MKAKSIILLIGLFFALAARGQEDGKWIEIRGKVFDARSKKPIAGAVVSATSGTSPVETNASGEFVMRVIDPAKEVVVRYTKSGWWKAIDSWSGLTLTVQYTGFHPATHVVKEGQEILIYLLSLSVSNYSPEVTLPFISRKAGEQTGHSFHLSVKDQERGRTFSDDMLVGSVPGVRTLQKGGMPGEGNFVNYRGTRSLYGSNAPVFWVDGMPVLPNTHLSSVFTGYSRNIFGFMSQKELEHIAVVGGFDASPLGAIGANGVVVMNTERATDMDTRVEFESVNGVSLLPRKLPLLDATGFRDYFYQLAQSYYTSDEITSNFPFLSKGEELGEGYWAYQRSTDWQREIFSPAFSTENLLKVKGGDEIAKYTILAGYMEQNGIEDNSYLSRYYARFNGDMVMSRRLNMFTNVGFSHYSNAIFEQGMITAINPMLAAIQNPAIIGPKRVNRYGQNIDVWETVRQFNVSNPAFLVNNLTSDNYIYDIMINMGMNYTFTPSFVLKALMGIHYDYNREKFFVPGVSVNAVLPLSKDNTSPSNTEQNAIRYGMGESMAYYGNISFNYTKSVRDHQVDAVGGTQILFQKQWFEMGKGYNTPTDFNQSLENVQDAARKYLDGYDDNWKWGNAFLRLDYNYNKQLYAGLSATIESNSISGDKANLFEVNPAVNVAWKLHNTSLLQKIPAIQELTLRAEWSRKGNVLLPPMLGNFYYKTAYYKEMGGIVRANIPNDKLKPETQNTFNVGVDFNTLGRRLSLTLDIYRSWLTKVILPENLTGAFGSNSRYVNNGELDGHGLGISVRAIPVIVGDFQWNVGAIFSFDRTRIASLGGYDAHLIALSDGAEIISKKGESPYLFYGFDANGVYATTDEARASGLVGYQGKEFRGGDIRFVNTNADKIIDDKDKIVIGDPTPDFYGSISTLFRYKTFSLDALFTYSLGNDAYNAVRRVSESMNDLVSQSLAVKNRWSYEGQHTDMPRAELEDPMGNSRFSSRWIEDASFLKLKYLTLNYARPNSWWLFKTFEAYITAENLFVLTEYLGYDPEFAYSYDHRFLGVDYGKVPAARAFKLGVRLGL
ncbi:MAG: SusC/RagA family TonB-linked outer membrane protein [Odoribacteraceae bacterium]|jgi:TonB-linked SusC/RagA family outer membrane protein|nr:SusC/RagA family TonB-linked outer membrane protein [Odoribacteraceae bacterium]